MLDIVHASDGHDHPKALTRDQLKTFRESHHLPCRWCEKKMTYLVVMDISSLGWADRLLVYWGMPEADRLLLKMVMGTLTGMTIWRDHDVHAETRETLCGNHGILAGILQYVVYAHRFWGICKSPVGGNPHTPKPTVDTQTSSVFSWDVEDLQVPTTETFETIGKQEERMSTIIYKVIK